MEGSTETGVKKPADGSTDDIGMKLLFHLDELWKTAKLTLEADPPSGLTRSEKQLFVVSSGEQSVQDSLTRVILNGTHGGNLGMQSLPTLWLSYSR